MKPGSYTDRFSADEVQRYRDLGLWDGQTFFDLLDRQLRERPDKVFATDGTRSLTYRQLHDSVLRLAAGFHRRGWRAGDAIVVHLPNWVEFIEVVAALSRLGVITVPVMPIYRRDEVGYVLDNSGARAVITPALFKKFDYLDMYQGLREQRPELEIVVARPGERTEELVAASDSGVTTLELIGIDGSSTAVELPQQSSPDDPFVVVYTSGTTSRPKGCVHTFNTYCSGARSLTKAFGYSESDVQFGPSPIAHTTGLVTSVLLPLLNGASTHLMADWEPARGLAEIAQYRCSQVVTATTFLQMLLGAYDPDQHDASSLRVWTCAGSPVPAAVVERAAKTLPELNVLSLYGRSENLCTTTCSVTDGPERVLSSDGAAMPGHAVAIVDDEGVEVPPGTTGDIAYRGPSHMIEYLGNPDETTALFTQSGLSRSGDLGVMDEDGFVRVTGRTKDIIIRGGMNISAREIEDHLAAHPDLSASAVVGIPDDRLGERVACFVVTNPGATEPSVEGLRTYLTDHGVAIQKTPESVIPISSLPMTATGKIQKHVLREQAANIVKADGVGARN